MKVPLELGIVVETHVANNPQSRHGVRPQFSRQLASTEEHVIAWILQHLSHHLLASRTEPSDKNRHPLHFAFVVASVPSHCSLFPNFPVLERSGPPRCGTTDERLLSTAR